MLPRGGTPRGGSERNPLSDLGSQIRIIARDRVLGWAIAGNTYLWFLAALLQFVIVIYGHDVLRVDETQVSYLQAAVGIGLGVGSLVAGYLSGGKIEYGLIPVGAIGMTVFGFLVSQHGLEHLARAHGSGAVFWDFLADSTRSRSTP